MPIRARNLMLLAIACGLATALPAQAAASTVSFARDVLPILSDRCFSCHGPDSQARKAKLRLDDKTSVLRDRGGYAVVVPGHPKLSAMIARISSTDIDERMPPSDSNLSLSALEIATLRRWIEQGGTWTRHWAYEAPELPQVPAVTETSWPRTDLDRFVLAQLETRQLPPSAAADPGQLLRRLTLDLTGLPPTTLELDAFLADPSDSAYERAVDRLLSSPRYGERMAWPWLEAARYADTDGYQNDPTRAMWPWRDWLITTLNDNMPFDRFTIEALAGDLIPNATMEQILGSGFHRNHAHNGEGGRIAEETRIENVFDRTETTAMVWMGLTLECARCHDHKYDPITQRDYYRMFAFFDQTSERGSGAAGRVPPTLRYLSPQQRQAVTTLEQQIALESQRLTGPDLALDRAQAPWEQATIAKLHQAKADSRPTTLGTWWVVGTLKAPNGDAQRTFEHRYGPEDDKQFDRSGTYGPDHLAWREFHQLKDGKPLALPNTVGATYLRRSITAPTARTLSLSLGSDDGIQVWCNTVEVLAKNVNRGVAADQERLELEVAKGRNELLIKITNTGGAAGIYFAVAEESIAGLPASTARVLLKERQQRSTDEERSVLEHFRAQHSKSWRALQKRVADLTAKRDRLQKGAPEVMVMDQLPKARRRTTRILERGGYDRPGDAVTAVTPEFLPPMPEAAPRDRMGLARWLVSGHHPLTARVAVNHAWQLFFGRGLVKTNEDFGRQGSPPSHPALLDWLAVQFVQSGWDRKALHRLIVTSATYRQSASAKPAAYAADPENAWLARGSRHRMPAWMLRDQALALSGRLVSKLGGPPVKPYQPTGVWAEATFDKIRYKQDSGDALYRRSVYVFWRRIVGPTLFFDTPSRQACVVTQSRTNTPLHALTTLNETAFVEAARLFAERAVSAGNDTSSRIAWAFRRATCRRATASELQRLVVRWHKAREHFHRHPDLAESLLAIGEAQRNPALAADELAALAIVTAIILNLDETLTKP